ncbi:hypothetical protein NE237_026119 [Protea cynaroides]|uniref:Uncharacterized protein n=1 Tax=Protea cynaroides TaxID=273540 RepID=A0A9Q0H3M4_9MAGN|nr:hypothetical protein NE237_026119 [Protea cynaroides]
MLSEFTSGLVQRVVSVVPGIFNHNTSRVPLQLNSMVPMLAQLIPFMIFAANGVNVARVSEDITEVNGAAMGFPHAPVEGKVTRRAYRVRERRRWTWQEKGKFVAPDQIPTVPAPNSMNDGGRVDGVSATPNGVHDVGDGPRCITPLACAKVGIPVMSRHGVPLEHADPVSRGQYLSSSPVFPQNTSWADMAENEDESNVEGESTVIDGDGVKTSNVGGSVLVPSVHASVGSVEVSFSDLSNIDRLLEEPFSEVRPR